MTQVFIKRYGWLKVLEQSGNYSLCLFDNGSKICFNTNGFEFRNIETQLKIEL
jgi:hypothetical protein